MNRDRVTLLLRSLANTPPDRAAGIDRLAVAFAARAPRRAALGWLAGAGLGAALGAAGPAAPALAVPQPNMACSPTGRRCPP